MKKLLILAAMLPISLQAQENVELQKKVLCNKVGVILSAMSANGYKEVPVWSGSEGDSRLMLLANEKTGTWTLIQMNTQIACVIGSGEKHKMVTNSKYQL